MYARRNYMNQNIAWTRSKPSMAARSWLCIAIVLAALVIRAPIFGDLNYHIDEEFYLLVGDRMRNGLLPYIDIWDRKPFGLFLLYWAIASVGDGSMLVMQLAAAICAAATAVLVAMIVRRWVPPLACFLTAITYLAWLEALAGGGGQSPVFYNLPVTAMAFLTFKAGDTSVLPRLRLLAIASVLCGGVALTIKPTSLPECLYFGCILAFHVHRLSPDKMVVIREAAFLALLGMLPTLICLGFYTAIGHGLNYLFATVFSSFARMPMPWSERLVLATYLAPRIMPLLAMGIAGITLFRRGAGTTAESRVVIGWITAAIIGFLMVPNFYDHYALSLLPSLCVSAASLFVRRPLGPSFAMLSIGAALTLAGWPGFERTRHTNAAMYAATRTIILHGGGRSLYVFDGPVHLYTLTGAPLPTHWPFPEHLSTAEERNAIGTDVARELVRILRRRPAVIVAADQPGSRHPNSASWKMLRATVACDYNRVATINMPEFAGTRPIGIFALRLHETAYSCSKLAISRRDCCDQRGEVYI